MNTKKIMAVIMFFAFMILVFTGCDSLNNLYDPSDEIEENFDTYSLDMSIENISEGNESGIRVLIDGEYIESKNIDSFEWNGNNLLVTIPGLKGEVNIEVRDENENYIFSEDNVKVNKETGSLSIEANRISEGMNLKANINKANLYEYDIIQFEIDDYEEIVEIDKYAFMISSNEAIFIRDIGDSSYLGEKKNIETGEPIDLALLNSSGEVVARNEEVDIDNFSKSINLEFINDPYEINVRNYEEMSAQAVDDYLAEYTIRYLPEEEGTEFEENVELTLAGQVVTQLPGQYLVINHIAINLDAFFDQRDTFLSLLQNKENELGYDALNVYVMTDDSDNLKDLKDGEELEEFDEIWLGLTEYYDDDGNNESIDRATATISYSYYDSMDFGNGEGMITYNVTVDNVNGVDNARSFTIGEPTEDVTPFGTEIEKTRPEYDLDIFILGEAPEEIEEGDGVYKIENAEQLMELRDSPLIADRNNEFMLVSDIDLEEYDGWLPIGTSYNPFNATFNGNGFVISNLQIDRPDNNDVGLFGYNSGNVIDLILEDIEITGNRYVGGVAGRNDGTIQDVEIDNGSIEALYGDVGGIVGANLSVGDAFDLVIADITVDTGEGYNAGGFAGINAGSVNAIGIYGDNQINGFGRVGGLIGHNSGDRARVIAAEVLGETSVTGESDDIGGLAGLNEMGRIESSMSDAEVESPGNNIGGLVGRNVGEIDNINIDKSYATGSVIGYNSVGGLVGLNRGRIDLYYEADGYNEYRNFVEGNITADVTGQNYNIGGIIGHNREDGIISWARANNNIVAESDRVRRVGSLIGRNDNLDQYDFDEGLGYLVTYNDNWPLIGNDNINPSAEDIIYGPVEQLVLLRDGDIGEPISDDLGPQYIIAGEEIDEIGVMLYDFTFNIEDNYFDYLDDYAIPINLLDDVEWDNASLDRNMMDNLYGRYMEDEKIAYAIFDNNQAGDYDIIARYRGIRSRNVERVVVRPNEADEFNISAGFNNQELFVRIDTLRDEYGNRIELTDFVDLDNSEIKIVDGDGEREATASFSNDFVNWDAGRRRIEIDLDDIPRLGGDALDLIEDPDDSFVEVVISYEEDENVTLNWQKSAQDNLPSGLDQELATVNVDDYEGFKSAIDAVFVETIVLTNDIQLESENIEVERDIVLDLNNNDLDLNTNDIIISVNDLTIAGIGLIENGSILNNDGSLNFRTGSEVDLLDITLNIAEIIINSRELTIDNVEIVDGSTVEFNRNTAVELDGLLDLDGEMIFNNFGSSLRGYSNGIIGNGKIVFNRIEVLRDITIDVELEINGDVDFRDVTLEEESVLNNATLSLIQNADLTLNDTLKLNHSNSEIEGNGNEIEGNGEIVITHDGSGSKLKDVVLNVPLIIEGEEIELEAIVETGEIILSEDDIIFKLRDAGGNAAWKLNNDLEIPADKTLSLEFVGGAGSGTVDSDSSGWITGNGILVIGNDVNIDEDLYDEDNLTIN